MNARPKARGGVNAVRINHTPGPWAAHETDTRTAIKVVRLPPARRQERTIAYVQLGPNQDYDAALIAAAPALLSLAQKYASECGECSGVGVTPYDKPCDQCEDIREVIALATTVR